MASVRERWRSERLAAVLYDAGVERERVARVAGLAMWGTDTRLLYADIARVGELPDGASVLDVPCGGGVAFRGIRPGQRVRYVAVDLNPTMLARARREAGRRGVSGRVEIVEGDIESLPFEAASFDLCISYNGLHCLPDPPGALIEMARVLRPGGVLRGTSAVTGAGPRQDALIALYRRAGVFGMTRSAEELAGWLRRVGLNQVSVKSSGAVAAFEGVRPPAA
jgi:ubiquinone/menaquinone biosynthesis C-methylase UbiE